jgi:hypothetical protein
VNKTAGIVQKLVEPLFKLGYNTWMNNFHNLLIVVRTLKVMNKTNLYWCFDTEQEACSESCENKELRKY